MIALYCPFELFIILLQQFLRNKCEYKRNRWFKKPEFIDISQGHKIIVMGIKGEKGKANSEVIMASNIANLTTRKDLAPFDHSQLKKAKQQATKMQRR